MVHVVLTYSPCLWGLHNSEGLTHSLENWLIKIVLKVQKIEKKMLRPCQDSNLESPDPKSGALSIGPQGQMLSRLLILTYKHKHFV